MKSLERTLKAIVPRQAKGTVKDAIRNYGAATAPWRPMPDFLILGTKRGGSTSAWRYLIAHPQVLPMVTRWEHLKSPHYFYWHYDKGEAWYRGHFPSLAARHAAEKRLGKPVVCGDASPYYLFNPFVPMRVAQDMPNGKFLVLLRDPVKRAYSHYWERVGQGVEPLSFEEALAAEGDRLAGEAEKMDANPMYYSRPHDWYTYRERGIYAPQLQRWFEAVGRDRIKVVFSEDLYADPQATMDEIGQFLGIDSHPLAEAKRHNYIPVDPMREETKQELQEFYRPHNAALAALLDREPPWHY